MNRRPIADAPAPSKAYRLYVLALLTGVYFFYLLDRNAVIVTQEAFKAEFALSDTQVGLVTGLLYGGAYAAVGIPLGLMIDRLDRRRLLGLLVGAWSAVTALCGLSGQFWQLALARAVVGGAEAGGSPTSLSMLGDLFSEKRRATVAGIFFAGASLGGIVSFLAGGFIIAHFGWRAVFFTYGAPGMILAALIFFTIRDPAPDRQQQRGLCAEHPLHAMTALLGDRALVPVYLGSVLFSLSMAGVGVWMVPFLMRVHHLSITAASATAALSIGVGGGIGNLAAGWLADAVQRRWNGGTLLVVAGFALANLVFGLGAALSGSVPVAVGCFFIWGVSSTAYSGPSNAAISQLASAGRRGLGFALFAVLCNFVGAGLGSLLTGAISDALAARTGAASIRPALAAAALFQIVTVAAFLWARAEWCRRLPTAEPG